MSTPAAQELDQSGAGSAVAAHLTTSNGRGGAIPTSALHVRSIPWHVAKGFLVEHHYLHRVAPMQRLVLGIFESDCFGAALVGVMAFGRPLAANRITDGETLLELTRMFILDSTTKNAESRCLAVAARIIRQRFPEIKGLLAYSDLEGRGHKGTIYKAAGWTCDHITKPISWASHPRPRRDRGSNTTKLRWRKVL